MAYDGVNAYFPFLDLQAGSSKTAAATSSPPATTPTPGRVGF